MKSIAHASLLIAISFNGTEAGAAKPLRLDPLWRDPQVTATRGYNTSGGQCRFAIPPIDDLRENPELVGVLGRRKLLAPDDRAAWLRSILSGLPARGVDLKILSDFDRETDDRDPAGLILRSAWIDYYRGGFTAVVVFELTLGKPSSAGTKIIRGRSTTTDFLGDIRSRAEDSFRRSVAKALDEIAATMLASCS